MKSQFHFDKKTGTYVPNVSSAPQPSINSEALRTDVVESKNNEGINKPVFEKEKRLDIKSETANVGNKTVVQMQRTDRPTPVQLVNENGLPEAYLDSINTGVMMFRERDDYDLCQITDERTGKVLAFIGGYALQFNFNMVELNTLEKIEQCMQGIVKLLRHKIMTQNLRENK